MGVSSVNNKRVIGLDSILFDLFKIIFISGRGGIARGFVLVRPTRAAPSRS
jgi:hypothetical protein